MILASSRKLVRHVLREIASCVARYAWTSPRRLSRGASPTRSSTNAEQGVLSVQGFPQFDTLIKALKEGNVSREGRSFNVCVQQGEKLVVLQSFASKFTDADVTKDDGD